MILVFALAGIFTATVASVTALVMGHSWWIGLASYIGAGMLTVLAIAIFATVAPKVGARRTAPALETEMTLARQ